MARSLSASCHAMTSLATTVGGCIGHRSRNEGTCALAASRGTNGTPKDPEVWQNANDIVDVRRNFIAHRYDTPTPSTPPPTICRAFHRTGVEESSPKAHQTSEPISVDSFFVPRAKSVDQSRTQKSHFSNPCLIHDRARFFSPPRRDPHLKWSRKRPVSSAAERHLAGPKASMMITPSTLSHL